MQAIEGTRCGSEWCLKASLLLRIESVLARSLALGPSGKWDPERSRYLSSSLVPLQSIPQLRDLPAVRQRLPSGHFIALMQDATPEAERGFAGPARPAGVAAGSV